MTTNNKIDPLHGTGDVPDAPPTEQLGARGLSIWGGYVKEEYLTALQPWTREVRVYLEMRDDIVVGGLLDAIKTPLLKATVSVEPCSDDAADVEAAEWLQENLDKMDRQTLRSHITDLLEILDFGFALSEIVLEKREDGRLWIKNLDVRGQETLRRWILDPEEKDKVVGFQQGMFRGSFMGEVTTIPMSKMLHATFRSRKGNPQGRALLRSIYRPWRFAKNLENFEGIGVERDVGGMPVLELPAEKLTDAEITEVKKNLAAMKADEASYVIIPQGATLTAYSGGSRRGASREIIRDYHKLIQMRFFAQFLSLGMETVGSQALVQGSQDFFMLALQSLQEEIVEVWNQQLVPYLFGFNEFSVTELPKIVWAQPGHEDIAALVQAYSTAKAAGIMTPTREDEVHLRDAMGLPELPDDEGLDDRNAEPEDPFDQPPDIPGLGPMDISDLMREGAATNYAEAPDLRGSVGAYEKMTNAYQRRLVTAYDAWSRETTRLAALPGRTMPQVQEMIAARLTELESELTLLGRQNVARSAGMGLGRRLGKRASSPRVQNVIKARLATNEQYIAGLIDSIRTRAVTGLPETLAIVEPAARAEAFSGALTARRARVAQQAGGAIATIFEVQSAGGSEENAERRAKGEKPVAIKWVLDPGADHCEDDRRRATFGCPGLARTYSQGWDELVTVPAGNVSCLGTCRCALEANFSGKFERIT